MLRMSSPPLEEAVVEHGLEIKILVLLHFQKDGNEDQEVQPGEGRV